MTKQCADCRKILDVDRFYWVNKSTSQLRGQCKDCMRTRKIAQRNPAWTPACSRCGTNLPTRAGSGRRLCADCYAKTYDTMDIRPSGSRRVKLKPCSLCGGPKPRFERGKLCPDCKPWQHYASNLRRFGLTPANYLAMLAAQDGRCYICRTLPNGQRLSIDHDHSLPDCREAVRGLLCNDCNYSRIPRFAEDIAMLRRAADYLESPPASSVLEDPPAPRAGDRSAVGAGRTAYQRHGLPPDIDNLVPALCLPACRPTARRHLEAHGPRRQALAPSFSNYGLVKVERMPACSAVILSACMNAMPAASAGSSR